MVPNLLIQLIVQTVQTTQFVEFLTYQFVDTIEHNTINVELE